MINMMKNEKYTFHNQLSQSQTWMIVQKKCQMVDRSSTPAFTLKTRTSFKSLKISKMYAVF